MKDNVSLVECSICGKEKPQKEVPVMMEGAGIKLSKNSRVIEQKVRRWAEIKTGKKFNFFPMICFSCQTKEEGFQAIMRGKA